MHLQGNCMSSVEWWWGKMLALEIYLERAVEYIWMLLEHWDWEHIAGLNMKKGVTLQHWCCIPLAHWYEGVGFSSEYYDIIVVLRLFNASSNKYLINIMLTMSGYTPWCMEMISWSLISSIDTIRVENSNALKCSFIIFLTMHNTSQ